MILRAGDVHTMRTFASSIRADDASHARQHRIARRGITYEDIERLLTSCPNTALGCSSCVIKAISKDKFEFLQSRWANNTNFLREPTGVDPIIGHARDGESVAQRWPHAWGAPRAAHQSVPFGSFVTLQGGEYLFAPSINFSKPLMRLHSPAALPLGRGGVGQELCPQVVGLLKVF